MCGEECYHSKECSVVKLLNTVGKYIDTFFKSKDVEQLISLTKEKVEIDENSERRIKNILDNHRMLKDDIADNIYWYFNRKLYLKIHIIINIFLIVISNFIIIKYINVDQYCPKIGVLIIVNLVLLALIQEISIRMEISRYNYQGKRASSELNDYFNINYF